MLVERTFRRAEKVLWFFDIAITSSTVSYIEIPGTYFDRKEFHLHYIYIFHLNNPYTCFSFREIYPVLSSYYNIYKVKLNYF